MVSADVALPLLVQRPLHGSRGEAILPLLTPAAAYFDGDAIALHVECGANADVTLVSAGAMRLNRGHIRVRLAVHVAKGAVLRYLPHELIPYRDAEYVQTVNVELEEDAAAVLLDVVTPGRSDAAFSYRALSFETSVRRDARLVALERFRLAPASLHGYTHYGSLLAVGDTFDAEAAHDALAGADVWGSASTLPAGGVVLKALGRAADPLRRALLSSVGVPRDILAACPP